MSPSEWDGLAWWEQQMYLEGFEDEGLVERRDGTDQTVVSEEVHRSGGTTVTERHHETTFSMMPGEMAAFGLHETTLG